MHNTSTVSKFGVTETPIAPDAKGVVLQSVTKKYGPVTAVENITLSIPAGTYCCLLGPSGCGKTTTMRMIAGHEDITKGDIFMGDVRINALPPARRNTAMMFQNYALFPHKTVWQNVEFGLRMAKVKEPERRRRVEDMLGTVGLGAFATRKPHMLSGGQQQRVALARALVTRPQVLLLDEPLSALDESLRVKTRSELRKLQKTFGMTFIQVTHNQDEAYALADQIVVMDHGRIDQVGTPQEIFARPISKFVAQFTGDNNIFEGTVTSAAQDGDDCLIELDVDRVGTFLCRGEAVQPGVRAACCVRSDRLILKSLQSSPEDSISATPINHVTARITAVEFTGYVTRVSLALEKTGAEILYKARTDDWVRQTFNEGQVVQVEWHPNDCIFLAH